MEEKRITAPEPLSALHAVSFFDCGEQALNSWLKNKALNNENSGGSRTYVISIKNTVIGYYAIASGSVEHEKAPSRIKRNMPSPIPVMILGRLAIDKRFQGHNLGSFLLRDAILRIHQVSKTVGVRAILVHALSEKARNFYLLHGFQSSPINDMTLFLPIKDVETIIEKE